MAILATQDALKPDLDVTPLLARMTFLFMLPFPLIAPLAGVLADRLSRRWIMIFADLMRAAVLIFFFSLINFFTDTLHATWLQDWAPFIPLGMVGIFAAMFAPSRQAILPTLVPGDSLVQANALISGLGLIGTMAATVVSGVLADRGHLQFAFRLDAATFAASGLCVFMMTRKHAPGSARIHETPESFLTGLREGFRYVRGHRRVGQLLFIAAIFWFMGATVRSVAPAVVKQVYHGGFTEMARFPAWIALGIATGAIILTLLGRALRSEVAMSWSLVGTGVGIGGLALSVFAPLSPSTAHILGAVSIYIGGVFGAGITVSYNALLQRIVPNQFRGRVYGILNIVTVGSLLMATGTLGIPSWDNLDAWAGWILSGVSIVLIIVGIGSIWIRIRQLPLHARYAVAQELVQFICTFWYRLRRDGYCTIPRSGPVIITANHESTIDPFLIYSCCNYRYISFMIAAEYYNMRLAGSPIRWMKSIPVRRGENDMSATKTLSRRLKAGEALGIFIQGGIRNRSDEDDGLKNGVALFALRTGAKVIPAHISGTNQSESTVRPLFMRHNARIRFGPPVDLSEFKNSRGKDELNAASRKIFAAVKALAPANPPTPDADTDADADKVP